MQRGTWWSLAAGALASGLIGGTTNLLVGLVAGLTVMLLTSAVLTLWESR